jgi:hypothetical protein
MLFFNLGGYFSKRVMPFYRAWRWLSSICSRLVLIAAHDGWRARGLLAAGLLTPTAGPSSCHDCGMLALRIACREAGSRRDGN